MAKHELKDLAVTHISLVKAGANGKQIIYKSAQTDPAHEKIIKISKTDAEQGIVYGIVYAPDEVDSQGDFATAKEIQKAAYAFMKSQNGKVDHDHDFVVKDAYVAESWITKAGDPTFPDEPIGSWAVAIQLEDEGLRKDAREGNIAGLSMAGHATKVEVEKATQQETKNLVAAFTDAMSSLWIKIEGYVEKSQKENTLEPKEVEHAIAKAVEPIAQKVTNLEERNGSLEKENVDLKKRLEEAEQTLKKSRQDNSQELIEKSNTFAGKGVL